MCLDWLEELQEYKPVPFSFFKKVGTRGVFCTPILSVTFFLSLPTSLL